MLQGGGLHRRTAHLRSAALAVYHFVIAAAGAAGGGRLVLTNRLPGRMGMGLRLSHGEVHDQRIRVLIHFRGVLALRGQGLRDPDHQLIGAGLRGQRAAARHFRLLASVIPPEDLLIAAGPVGDIPARIKGRRGLRRSAVQTAALIGVGPRRPQDDLQVLRPVLGKGHPGRQFPAGFQGGPGQVQAKPVRAIRRRSAGDGKPVRTVGDGHRVHRRPGPGQLHIGRFGALGPVFDQQHIQQRVVHRFRDRRGFFFQGRRIQFLDHALLHRLDRLGFSLCQSRRGQQRHQKKHTQQDAHPSDLLHRITTIFSF